MVHLIRKSAILGLAAFGAYRLYELAKPAAEQVRPPLNDAIDNLRSAATQVRDDVVSAKDDVVDDIKIAADDQQQKLTEAAQNARHAVERESSDAASTEAATV